MIPNALRVRDNGCSEAARCGNTERPLTRSSDLAERGLLMEPTQTIAIGHRFGRLVVTGRAEPYRDPRGDNKCPRWECLCDCGTITVLRASSLRSGGSVTCGCMKHEGKVKDMTGARCGRLVVVERAGTYVNPSGRTYMATWLCVCDCGSEAVVVGHHLREGSIASCGCLEQESRHTANRREIAGYEAAHSRLRRSHGKASTHPCADCGSPAREWSYDGLDPDEMRGGRNGCLYSLDPSHYAPRCHRCHCVYDAAMRRAKPRFPSREAALKDAERHQEEHHG